MVSVRARLACSVICITFLCIFAVSVVHAYRDTASLQARNPQQEDDFLVVPGERVGQLRLGGSEEDISLLAPAPNLSKISIPNCGTEYFVALIRDARHPAALNVFMRNNKIFEIEAIRGRYHTKNGTATNTPSDDVRSNYQGLDAYLYLGQTSEALNESPLIVWSDNNGGLAFALTRDSKSGSAYSVYSSIIFPPKSVPCVEGYPLDSQSWQQLSPYSLGEPRLANVSLTKTRNLSSNDALVLGVAASCATRFAHLDLIHDFGQCGESLFHLGSVR